MTLWERLRARRGAGVGAPRAGRGSTMVEAAIITPLVVLLLLGVVEFGWYMKDDLTLSNASRAGARAGSAAGKDGLADYQVLQAIRGGLDGLAKVDKVVIFKGTGPSSTVPVACSGATSGTAGLCNVYDASDLTLTDVQFLAAGYTKDDSWPASSRQTSLSAAGGPDYLGVWVRTNHASITKAILNDKTIDDGVIVRLEPTR